MAVDRKSGGIDPESMGGLLLVVAAIPLGIALGLFLGKQAGIFLFSLAAIKSGLCRMPAGASFGQLYGVAMLGGIGFTMSLFIGMLAFPDPALAADIRVGVLAGSLASAALGYLVLRVLATGTAGRKEAS